MASFVEKVFSVKDISNSEQGFLGGAFGTQGKIFGSAGAAQGYQGADNAPKFDLKDAFDPESYFQLSNLFDVKKLWNPDDYLVDALKS